MNLLQVKQVKQVKQESFINFLNLLFLLFLDYNEKLKYVIIDILLFLPDYYCNWSFIYYSHNFFYLKKACYILLNNNYVLVTKTKKINPFFEKQKKFLKFGIYIRNFLKNKEILNQKPNSCYLIIRFKKKNLFLTLLNAEGNVLCKSNIGSCGFKKKVKYTGFAIKRTSKRFSKKILGSFIKTLVVVRKESKYKIKKIKDLIFATRKNYKQLDIINKQLDVINKDLIFINENQIIKQKLKIKGKKDNQIKINNISKIANNLNKFNKQIIREHLLNIKLVKKFNIYRKYPHISIALKKAFNIIIRIKSSFKFWGFRFVMYGIVKRFRWFNGLEIRLPLPHSDGLRLKKKRRI